jgi:predicted N-acyltransferase
MTLSIAARGNLEVQYSSTVDTVDAGQWNELSGASSLYLSHAWLRHVERGSGADCAYLLVRDSGGTLLGALPTYRIQDEQNTHYRTDLVLDGRLSGRHLLAGTCRAYHNDLLLHPALADDEQDLVLGMLLEAAERRAAELGCDDVVFLYLTTQAATRLARVRPGLNPLLLSMDTALPVAGEGIEDYYAALGARRAYGVRKDMRIYDDAGYTTAVEPLSACWYEAAPLVANVQNRHGQEESVEECRVSLHSQARALDTQSLAFTARRDGRLVAMALHYAWRGTLHGRMVGFDYEALAGAREYFTLYYYRPLRWAYEHGFRALHLGTGSYSAKFRRGARPIALWAASLTPARAGDWRGWNTGQVTTWRGEVGLDGLDLPADWGTGPAA